MVGVLLLNASFEPIYVISLQRAVLLLLGGQALPVQGEPLAATLRSPSISIEVPQIIQLRRYVNVPRRGAAWSRASVFQRDGYRCIYCGAQPGDKQRGKILTKSSFNLDHIIPRSRGGDNTWGNTAVSCQRCNDVKRSRTPQEAGLKLLWEPKTPRTSYLVVRGEVPVAWKKYIELG
jgi:5-methylcytosine-specific restriction endonuclease McrA